MDYTAKKRKLKNILGVISTIACILSCSQQTSYLNENSFNCLKIAVNITLEDAINSRYALEWNDSFEITEGKKVIDKPYELHCYISDTRGHIANYQGSSTSFNFCYFQTADSLIDVIFILRANLNSKNMDNYKSMPDSAWLNTNIEFEKASLPVKPIAKLKLVLSKSTTKGDIVMVKNNCTKKQTLVYHLMNVKRTQRIIKAGDLLKLKMRTGDIIEVQNNGLTYTHIAKNKNNIYLCDLIKK